MSCGAGPGDLGGSRGSIRAGNHRKTCPKDLQSDCLQVPRRISRSRQLPGTLAVCILSHFGSSFITLSGNSRRARMARMKCGVHRTTVMHVIALVFLSNVAGVASSNRDVLKNNYYMHIYYSYSGYVLSVCHAPSPPSTCTYFAFDF